jgi:hypothetical protein
MDPRASLDALEKRKFSGLCYPADWQATIPSKVSLPLKKDSTPSRSKCTNKGRSARPFMQHHINTLAMLQDVYWKDGAARKLESPALQALAIYSWHLVKLSTATASVFKSVLQLKDTKRLVGQQQGHNQIPWYSMSAATCHHSCIFHQIQIKVHSSS